MTKARLGLQVLWFWGQLTIQKRPNVGKNKRVFLHVTTGSSGKYFYCLITFFISEGYSVSAFPSLRFLGSILRHKLPLLQSGHFKLGYNHHQSAIVISAEPLEIQSDQKLFRLSFDYFKPRPGVIVPYPMSPHNYRPGLQAELDKLRLHSKTIGVFFSGNHDPQVYDTGVIEKKFKKVNRHRLITFLKNNFPADKLTVLTDGLHLSSSYINQLVIADWRWSPTAFHNAEARIGEREWLSTLAACHFFLACPGMVMPMCHNVIEAMAVGTIPILEYADEFYPPLSNGINCICFNGEKDALEQIERALALPANEIEKLRKAVIHYYEEHLSPAAFVRSVSNDTTDQAFLTINAEQQSI